MVKDVSNGLGDFGIDENLKKITQVERCRLSEIC
jgi:hypothetical protein